MPSELIESAAGDPTGGVVHLIQTALTPVFLLSGIAGLLVLFNTRLARVSDDMEHAADLLKGDVGEAELVKLRRHIVRLAYRMFVLDAAIALGAIGGASTCGAALVLFLGSIRMAAFAGWLITLFAAALSCTVIALIVFLLDSVLAWHGLHRDGPLPRSSRGSAR